MTRLVQSSQATEFTTHPASGYTQGGEQCRLRIIRRPTVAIPPAGRRFGRLNIHQVGAWPGVRFGLANFPQSTSVNDPGIAAYRRHDLRDVGSDHFPAIRRQADKRQFPSSHVLFVSKVLSAVTSTSKPESSAAFKRAPFSNAPNPA